MVSGHLQCIGSSQHLKSRFGAGYQLDVSFTSQSHKQQFLQLYSNQSLPASEVLPDLIHTEDMKQQGVQDEEKSEKGQHGNPLCGLVIEEEHTLYLRCKLPNEIDLAEAFTLLERLKIRDSSKEEESSESREELISDYSLSQSTLEQIFINFAKHQEEEQPMRRNRTSQST